ncbi:MAG: flagellar hook-length control protein FliK [Nitrospirae bacterium]|nr:flagellar hook-length control protein FliK [Nitrospirota bacterium]MBI3352054.1 flagellar hook-length control protein FliK [Nitrospirota bacterium]
MVSNFLALNPELSLNSPVNGQGPELYAHSGKKPHFDKVLNQHLNYSKNLVKNSEDPINDPKIINEKPVVNKETNTDGKKESGTEKGENKIEVKEEKPSVVFQDSPNDIQKGQNLPVLLDVKSEDMPEQMEKIKAPLVNPDDLKVINSGTNKALLTAQTPSEDQGNMPEGKGLKDSSVASVQQVQLKGDSADEPFINSDPRQNGQNLLLTKGSHPMTPADQGDQKEGIHSGEKNGVENKTDLPAASSSFNPSIDLSQKVDEGASGLKIQGSKGDFLEVFNPLPEEEQNVLRQVANSFVLQPASKEEKISLKLEPESMGSLQIDIHLHHKEVKAEIIASHPVVRDLLEKHQDLLRNTLLEYGLKFEKLSVSDSSSHFKQNDYPPSRLRKGEEWDSPVRPAQAISQGLPGIQTNHRMDHQISLYV